MNKEYKEMRDKIMKIYGRFPYLIPANQFLSIETDTCRIAVVKKTPDVPVVVDAKLKTAEELFEKAFLEVLESQGFVQEVII